jgi:hypothetical protein
MRDGFAGPSKSDFNSLLPYQMISPRGVREITAPQPMRLVLGRFGSFGLRQHHQRLKRLSETVPWVTAIEKILA